MPGSRNVPRAVNATVPTPEPTKPPRVLPNRIVTDFLCSSSVICPASSWSLRLFNSTAKKATVLNELRTGTLLKNFNIFLPVLKFETTAFGVIGTT